MPKLPAIGQHGLRMTWARGAPRVCAALSGAVRGRPTEKGTLTPPPLLSLPQPRWLRGVAFAVLGVVLVLFVPASYVFDNGSHLEFGRALYHHRLDVIPFGIDTATAPDGRSYSPAAPGMGALVAVGFTVVGEAMTHQALPVLAALFLIYVAADVAGLGLGLAALLVLAPPLQYYVHGLSDVSMSAALILCAATARSDRIAGLAAGFIPVFDYRLMPLTLVAFSARATVLPALIGWAILALYHTAAFGAPWRVAQQYVTAFPWSNTLWGMYGWWTPWQGLAEVLLATGISDPVRMRIGEPRYALLVVAPWLVLAPFGWWWVRSRRYVVALALSAATAALLCTHRTVIPRYLVPLVPLWIVPTLRVFRGRSRGEGARSVSV